MHKTSGIILRLKICDMWQINYRFSVVDRFTSDAAEGAEVDASHEQDDGQDDSNHNYGDDRDIITFFFSPVYCSVCCSLLFIVPSFLPL